MPRSINAPAVLVRSTRILTAGLIMMLAMALLPMLPAQPVAAASGAITVGHFSCPPEVDFASAAFGDLDSTCLAPIPDDPFSMQPTGGAASVLNTDANGIVSWASSDPGDGTITQVNPTGAETRVFCSVHEDGVLGTILESNVAGGAIGYSIPDGQLMDCVWFSYQPVLAGSEIKLQKWVCPDDFDAAAAGSLDELWAACTTPGADFPFARVPDGGDPPVELQADAGGAITLARVHAWHWHCRRDSSGVDPVPDFLHPL